MHVLNTGPHSQTETWMSQECKDGAGKIRQKKAEDWVKVTRFVLPVRIYPIPVIINAIILPPWGEMKASFRW